MAQRKRKADDTERPGQSKRPSDTRPRGQFEQPAGPELTNRDHPTAPGEYATAPGIGKISLETELNTDAPGLPDHKQQAGEEARFTRRGPSGDAMPLDPPGVTPAAESAGDAAGETNDPNFSAAHMERSISHRDAGVPRMDTSGRPERPPMATHSSHPHLVRDVMTADVEVCNPETELYYVARMMMERDCGSIPVVESTNTMRLVGTVTDRDIVVRCIAKNANPLTERARDCMSTDLVTIAPEEPLGECVRRMEEAQIRRIPVVDHAGRLCGIVAQADVVASADEHVAAELLKEVSEPLQQAPRT